VLPAVIAQGWAGFPNSSNLVKATFDFSSFRTEHFNPLGMDSKLIPVAARRTLGGMLQYTAVV
jgi:hypothetical protein